MNKYSLTALFCSLTIFICAQNVGIGTLNPNYKLDVVTRLDTTLRINNVGIPGLPTSTSTRVGILNLMNDITAGSRKGMSTQITFPNTPGAHDIYTGYEILFDGFCFPLGSGCDSSDIFGMKIDIPVFSNDGTHYGVYSKTPRLTGYAGYFEGRGYFSRMVGMGVDPDDNQQLFVRATSTSIVPLNRAARFQTVSMNNTTERVEGIYTNISGRSSDENIAGRFGTYAYQGDALGVYTTVSNLDGPSIGMRSTILSGSGNRTGVLAEVPGGGSGSKNGVHAIISGNAGSSTIYGIRSDLYSNTSSGYSFGIHAVNQNTSNNAFAAFLSGKTKMVNAQSAAYTGGGHLQIGHDHTLNVVYDNNEILARDNGGAAPLWLQHQGGDLMLCAQEFGTVAIGIASENNVPDGYLLAVDGQGVFEELKVKLSQNWPDYVFQENYDLTSIDELKKHIAERGHLPNIPSAKEVEKDGIHLGEMQRRAIEKIEELTLYIIQQQEQINLLKLQMNKLMENQK